VVTAVAALAAEGVFSALSVAVILSRDLATSLALLITRRMRAFKGVVFAARLPGKVVTVLQFMVLVVAIAAPRRVTPLILVLGVASAIAIADYGRSLWMARVR
jgi:hypothetical protein